MVATAPEVARHLADALEHAGIPYAIGGALALSVWGFPRATNDVDLDVFVSLEALDPALEVLRQAGCLFDRAGVLSSAASRGDFAVRYAGMRVDVFIPSIPVYASAQQRVRRAPLLGRQASYLAPEDLAIFKMLFFRTKDILDVERLLAFGADRFDRGYVRNWLVDLVGGDDERVGRWDRLVEDVDASLSGDAGDSGT
jgi:hypothetical protein